MRPEHDVTMRIRFCHFSDRKCVAPDFETDDNLTADRLGCTIFPKEVTVSTATAQEIYKTWMQPLSTTERLRLAALILNDITPALTIDEDDAWSGQDLHDLSAFALDILTVP